MTALRSNADLRRLTARLDALAAWRDDLLARIAVAKEKLHADGNLYFSRLYPDELDDLIDAVRAWRLTAARVVVDFIHQNDDSQISTSTARMATDADADLIANIQHGENQHTFEDTQIPISTAAVRRGA